MIQNRQNDFKYYTSPYTTSSSSCFGYIDDTTKKEPNMIIINIKMVFFCTLTIPYKWQEGKGIEPVIIRNDKRLHMRDIVSLINSEEKKFVKRKQKP